MAPTKKEEFQMTAIPIGMEELSIVTTGRRILRKISTRGGKSNPTEFLRKGDKRRNKGTRREEKKHKRRHGENDNLNGGMEEGKQRAGTKA